MVSAPPQLNLPPQELPLGPSLSWSEQPARQKDKETYGGNEATTPSGGTTMPQDDKGPPLPGYGRGATPRFPKRAKMSQLLSCFWTSSPRRKHQANGRPTRRSETSSVLLCSNKPRAPCPGITNQRPIATSRPWQQQTMPRCDNLSSLKEAWHGSHLANPKRQVKTRGACLAMGLGRRDVMGRVAPIDTNSVVEAVWTPMGAGARRRWGLGLSAVVSFEHWYRNDTGHPPIS